MSQKIKQKKTGCDKIDTLYNPKKPNENNLHINP